MFEKLIILTLLAFAVSTNTNYSPRRPIYSPALTKHLSCCTAFDTVLLDLNDKVDDTEDESKDLEDKVKVMIISSRSVVD